MTKITVDVKDFRVAGAQQFRVFAQEDRDELDFWLDDHTAICLKGTKRQMLELVHYIYDTIRRTPQRALVLSKSDTAVSALDWSKTLSLIECLGPAGDAALAAPEEGI
jgi:hypothetical protein